MTYYRVIPRDLFNEAKLLKCLGRLVILASNQANPLEDSALSSGEPPSDFMLVEHHDGEAFQIEQNQGTGNLYCANVEILRLCSERGLEVWKPFDVFNPINSRADWPLLFLDSDGEHCHVFDQDDPNGNLSKEFLAHIGHA